MNVRNLPNSTTLKNEDILRWPMKYIFVLRGYILAECGIQGNTTKKKLLKMDLHFLLVIFMQLYSITA